MSEGTPTHPNNPATLSTEAFYLFEADASGPMVVRPASPRPPRRPPEIPPEANAGEETPVPKSEADPSDPTPEKS